MTSAQTAARALVALARGLGVLAVALAKAVAAQELPDRVDGKAQVYDGATFDVIHGAPTSGLYRMATRLKLESVHSCEPGKRSGSTT